MTKHALDHAVERQLLRPVEVDHLLWKHVPAVLDEVRRVVPRRPRELGEAPP